MLESLCNQNFSDCIKTAGYLAELFRFDYLGGSEYEKPSGFVVLAHNSTGDRFLFAVRMAICEIDSIRVWVPRVMRSHHGAGLPRRRSTVGHTIL
jgi:hypothetical protein